MFSSSKLVLLKLSKLSNVSLDVLFSKMFSSSKLVLLKLSKLSNVISGVSLLNRLSSMSSVLDDVKSNSLLSNFDVSEVLKYKSSKLPISSNEISLLIFKSKSLLELKLSKEMSSLEVSSLLIVKMPSFSSSISKGGMVKSMFSKSSTCLNESFFITPSIVSLLLVLSSSSRILKLLSDSLNI